MARVLQVNQVYVISYDSKYNPGQRIYLQTSPSHRGVPDIQEAHCYTRLANAIKDAQSLKMGNPRVERHRILIDENPLEIIEP